MNRLSFLKWLRNKMSKVEVQITIEDDKDSKWYKQGYLDALEDIETNVGYGIFEEIVYVKPINNTYPLNNSEIYSAYSVCGGKYFEIYIEELDEIKQFNRDLFEIVEIKDHSVTSDYE